MPKRRIKRRVKIRKKVKITRRTWNVLPIKFNRRTRNIIYKALEARIPIKRSAELAGINYSTYNKWFNKGLNPDKYPVHYCFRRKVQRIQIGHERSALEIINKVAQGGEKITETKITMDGDMNIMESTRTVKHRASVWQAAAWWLERRLPDEYAQNKGEQDGRSIEETALEIKRTADGMFNSVPLQG